MYKADSYIARTQREARGPDSKRVASETTIRWYRMGQDAYTDGLHCTYKAVKPKVSITMCGPVNKRSADIVWARPVYSRQVIWHVQSGEARGTDHNVRSIIKAYKIL